MSTDNGRPGGTTRSSETTDTASTADEAVVTVSEERAVARRLRMPVERLRVAKRVRTRTVRVQADVEVSYEELVVTREPVDPEQAHRLAETVMEDDDDTDRTVVLVLSEQVPVIELATRPVERVTITTHHVQATQRVVVDLAREVVDITGPHQHQNQDPGASPR
jgi:stress response protein YsnF